MEKIKYLPIHCVLISVFQILSLYATNVNKVDISTALFIILLSILMTTFIFLLFLLITKDIPRSGLIASLYCFMFFIYGRLYEVLPRLQFGGLIIGRNKFLLIIFVIMIITFTLFVMRSSYLRKVITNITLFLNVFSFGLVVITVIITLFSYDWVSVKRVKNNVIGNNEIVLAERVSKYRESDFLIKPNIYFIVFDSYSSSYALRKYYNWDDYDLVNGLRKRGFIVNDNAFSNYPFTELSMASILNMCYIHEGPEFVAAKSKSKYLAESIRENEVMKRFSAEGYFVHRQEYSSEEHKSKNNKGNIFEKVLSLFQSELMGLVIHTSILCVIEPELIINYHRKTILYAIDKLKEPQKRNLPTFIYAHILCPHPPYVFRADGSKPKITESFFGRFGNRDEYIEQLKFIGKQIIEIVDSIKKQDSQAIIIVQADHGIGYVVGNYLFRRARPSKDFVEAQYGILSAIYLPAGINMPERITPVNLFRHLCNSLFNDKKEVLPDKVFFTPIEEPYVFYEVTNDIQN